MAHKLKLKDIGMDSMEILYYERQIERKKAYIAKRKKKSTTKKEITYKGRRREQDSNTFNRKSRKLLYNMC